MAFFVFDGSDLCTVASGLCQPFKVLMLCNRLKWIIWDYVLRFALCYNTCVKLFLHGWYQYTAQYGQKIYSSSAQCLVLTRHAHVDFINGHVHTCIYQFIMLCPFFVGGGVGGVLWSSFETEWMNGIDFNIWKDLDRTSKHIYVNSYLNIWCLISFSINY